MLSKLTFSLVFVLMVALVAGPAFAQTMTITGDLSGDAVVTAKSFVVADKTVTAPATNGLDDGTGGAVSSVVSVFPDLNGLFEFGGTIELVLLKSLGSTSTTPAVTAGALYDAAITEVMWGLNEAGTTAAAQASLQWIEVYNSKALLATDDLRLLFTTNKRVERDKVELENSGGAAPTAGSVTAADADTAAADKVVYTVLDRVSVINRFGTRWAPKGQSGRLTASADGTQPVQNLVSMYRKRSTNDEKDGYKYKDTKPDGDKFGDGTDGGQWIESAGRFNMTGNFIGSPGTVQQDDGGIVTQSQDPASLPGSPVIINEIYNSAGLQWIELYNGDAASANVKKWTMHAVYGDEKQDRVFSIPDKDTIIPAGGFLVITNRDPADSILAGGVDVHDSNKFPAGAKHLYIVVNAAEDKWMPEKGFLLVLREGNDKTNHEKIVDIAGNAFVEKKNFSDVWPLRGWTVPGDRDDNSFGNAENSLAQNTGKTYARDAQKSQANRLHKGDWIDNGAGIVGGLGYDPGVDLAIAPGTPGYANNAQKDKTADITGEVVISEIMYDAGSNGNLVQWIEIYNSSMTESATLNGWEMEIRNMDTDVESYADSHFKFNADAVILPNQTLLLVSDRSSASDVKSNRVYNLYQNHRADLGLSSRKSILLSSVGFYLALKDKDRNIVDVAGNVTLDGPRRTVQWALPETGGAMRHSILRGFGTKAFDGTPDAANDGTMESSWIVAESVGSYYGHRDDVGSPGHREGSPLPVSLSSFRPVRDKATGEVVITWVTESELNNAGFNILRSETKDSAFKVINAKGIIVGHGTTSEKHVYTYTDTTAKPNVVYYYQIEDVSLNGERTTLRTTHLRGNVSAGGKLTTRWGELKSSGK